MLTDTKLGAYSDIVKLLQVRLKAAVLKKQQQHKDSRFKIVTVGHGGRDTWLSLTLIEAVAFDDDLHDQVNIIFLTCTWPHDGWEKSMEQYLGRLKEYKKLSLIHI